MHLRIAERLNAENQESQVEVEPLQIEEITNMEDLFPDLFQEINTDEFVHCLAQQKMEESVFEAADRDNDADAEVVVVSGLPRSGTSMMMQMLNAAELTPYTDSKREADENNPKGYFESEIAKQLARTNTWIEECQGKVVKIVAPLIPYLPQKFRYKVIFMDREIEEIIESQSKMLELAPVSL